MSNELTPYYANIAIAQREARNEAKRIADLPADLQSGVELSHNPHAAAAAADARAAEAARPDERMMMEWLTHLNTACANPLSGEEMREKYPIYMRVLGRYPVFCWDDDMLDVACERFKFFPAVAELSDLMRPEFEQHWGMIDALERMASADARGPLIGIASRTPYPLPVPPEEIKDPRHFKPSVVSRAVDPVRTREQQMAELGFIRHGTAPDGRIIWIDAGGKTIEDKSGSAA